MFGKTSPECREWFHNSKIGPGIFCHLDCMGMPVEDNTVFCPFECPDLCELNFGKVSLLKVASLYPGLTSAERALVAEFPYESLRAYAYSWRAERSCTKIYYYSRTNDESDACRHCVWAGILTGAFGQELTKRFLDAHENDANAILEEKAMDLANNRAGILACERLKKKNGCFAEVLIEEFITELNRGNLIVIRPRGRVKK